MEKLIEKAKKYLESNNISYTQNTISYGGLRENKTIDVEEKFHIVFFNSETFNNSPYGFTRNALLFDGKNLELVYFMDNHILKKIEK